MSIKQERISLSFGFSEQIAYNSKKKKKTAIVKEDPALNNALRKKIH